jgi:multidrug efflux pump subunit AcrA (membrane-fusion protein)
MTSHPEAAPSREPPPSKWERASLAIQLLLAFAISGGVFLFLLWSGGEGDDEHQRPVRPAEVVRIAGPRTLFIEAGTPLDGKLDKDAKVRLETLTTPLLPVTGTVLVSLRKGDDEAKDSWQFATSDLLAAFADWQRAITDLKFQKKQLTLITEMNDKRVKRQEEVVGRKRELVSIGTETREVLAAEETNLIAFEIQKRKEIHEQETQVRLAERTEATLARQLQQAGLEPTMLREAASEGDIVVADVPEKMVRHVKVGMHCQVDFFALPDHKPPFTGRVSSISPVISKEKRVASVQFIVNDPDKELRPGMFGKIGLGDERKALVMPADGVLHIGDRDYVLVAGKDGEWQIFQVEPGELLKNAFDLIPGDLVRNDIEILSGFSLENPARKLQQGDRVIGKGAILLQPMVIRALQAPLVAAEAKPK